ncbi:MAG: hypothetical protein Kow00123_20470 [Anaerolineales bacterium]
MMRFRLRPMATILGFLAVIVVSVWNFGVWAGLCGVAAAATVFFASALAYTEFYGDAWTAIRYHWSIMVGTTRGFHKIEDGATSLPRDARGPVLGPRLVIVAPYNAVVLEQGSRQTAIRGPEVFRTRPFEFVKRIYDLRPRQRAMEFRDVLTRDGLLTTVALSATYSIAIAPAVKIGQRKMTASDRRILQAIDICTADWEESVRSAIERSARDVVRARDLSQLVGIRMLDALAGTILQRARPHLARLGIYLDQLRVDSVQPTSEVTGAQTELWVAEVEQRTNQLRMQSLADWVSSMSGALASARERGLSEEALYKEAWCRAIERMSKNIPEGLILEPEVEKSLITLRRSAGLAP